MEIGAVLRQMFLFNASQRGDMVHFIHLKSGSLEFADASLVNYVALDESWKWRQLLWQILLKITIIQQV